LNHGLKNQLSQNIRQLTERRKRMKYLLNKSLNYYFKKMKNADLIRYKFDPETWKTTITIEKNNKIIARMHEITYEWFKKVLVFSHANNDQEWCGVLGDEFKDMERFPLKKKKHGLKFGKFIY
jgi:hypothetical protein